MDAVICSTGRTRIQSMENGEIGMYRPRCLSSISPCTCSCGSVLRFIVAFCLNVSYNSCLSLIRSSISISLSCSSSSVLICTCSILCTLCLCIQKTGVSEHYSSARRLRREWHGCAETDFVLLSPGVIPGIPPGAKAAAERQHSSSCFHADRSVNSAHVDMPIVVPRPRCFAWSANFN